MFGGITGKTVSVGHRHNFTFRRLITCSGCGHSLIGERQKGHVYYRCQVKNCPMKCVREGAVEAVLEHALRKLELTKDELRLYVETLDTLAKEERVTETKARGALQLRLDSLAKRLERLTDALLDQIVDEDTYESKRQSLVLERNELEEKPRSLDENPTASLDAVRRYLELAREAWLSYEAGESAQRRELVRELTSNRTANPNRIVVELSNPYQLIADRPRVSTGCPSRDTDRTLKCIRDFIQSLVSAIRNDSDTQDSSLRFQAS